MSHLRKHGPHRAPSARQRLRASKNLDCLDALDLLILACDEAVKDVPMRAEPGESKEIRESLQELRKDAVHAKLMLLDSIKTSIRSLGNWWKKDHTGYLRQIGEAIVTGDYSKVAP